MYPHIQSAALGEHVTFTCFYTQPLTWSFNNGPLHPNVISTWNSKATKNILHIMNFQEINVGHYKCELEDTDHQLVLYDIGQITVSPRSMEAYTLYNEDISMHFLTSKFLYEL